MYVRTYKVLERENSKISKSPRKVLLICVLTPKNTESITPWKLQKTPKTAEKWIAGADLHDP